MTQEKVKAVNKLLLEGEPHNISVDEHSGYVGYRPQHIIDVMNEVFWGEWGFEEVSSEIIPSEKGGLAIAQVRVWLKGVPDFQPTSYGQNRVTRGDIGDAKKGAQTDAIKKALSYFSIGNRAYQGLLHVEDKQQSNGYKPLSKQPAQQKSNQPIDAPLPSELRARAKELGKDFDAVVKFLFKKSIPDNELTPNDCQFIHVTFEKSAAIRKTAASTGSK